MAIVSLAGYDGSAGCLVDSSIWIDCIDTASAWNGWAVDQLQACSERAPLHVNLVIYTELLVPGPDIAALDAMLDVYDTRRSALPWARAALAATAFRLYTANVVACDARRCLPFSSAPMRPWPTSAW